MSNKKETIRVQVILTREQYDLIQKLKGELGLSDSEVIRNIIISWLSEKSFLSTTLKNKIFGDKKNELRF